MKGIVTRLALAGWALVPPAFAAEAVPVAAPAHRFAAPEVAASHVTGAAGGIGQMLFGLVVVLATVFVVAFVARRLRGGRAAANGIEVVAQASLGAKERAVIVRVDGERLLLGVASGQVTLLKTLSADGAAPPPAVTGSQIASFGALLRRSLGK
ncbi:MAG TPA: flagellar biosynthetic protein FliO [Steroidobacteraceae bacterium]|nr:flagellar biosynthetic protein FliO [Steroidobacteraceae bacterium]